MFMRAGIPAYGRADYGNGCCDGFAPNFPLILIREARIYSIFTVILCFFYGIVKQQRLLSVILYTPWVKMKLQGALISL